MGFSAYYTQLINDADLYNSLSSNIPSSQSVANDADSANSFYGDIGLIGQKISPLLELSESPYGASEKIAADIQDCVNHIQNLVNGGGDASSVVKVAKELDQLLNLLNPKAPGSPEATYVQTALGSVATQQLFNNLLTMRQTIYLGNGDPYDPTTSVPGTPPIDTITPNDATGTIQTFAQLQADMGQPGDPGGANHIYHTILTAHGTITTTLTTATNIADTKIKILSTEDQTWLSFMHTLMQAFVDMEKAPTQHMQSANG